MKDKHKERSTEIKFHWQSVKAGTHNVSIRKYKQKWTREELELWHTLYQVCVPSPREACLTPSCAPWGECRDLESGKRVGPPSLPAPPTCWPNQAVLSNSCARLTLLLDRTQLPRGVTTEGLCMELRHLVASHQAAISASHRLVLLCDLKQGYNDTLEVTMVINIILFHSLMLSM